MRAFDSRFWRMPAGSHGLGVVAIGIAMPAFDDRMGCGGMAMSAAASTEVPLVGPAVLVVAEPTEPSWTWMGKLRTANSCSKVRVLSLKSMENTNIKSLITVKVIGSPTREEKEEFLANTTCIFCLEPLWINPVTTKCGHTFCEACLYQWLQNKLKSCSLCRTPLMFHKLEDIRPTIINDDRTKGYEASEDGMIVGVDDEEGDDLQDDATSQPCPDSLFTNSLFTSAKRGLNTMFQPLQKQT